MDLRQPVEDEFLNAGAFVGEPKAGWSLSAVNELNKRHNTKYTVQNLSNNYPGDRSNTGMRLKSPI